MAATRTLSQLSPSNNSAVPRHGVVTLYGYGIKVHVDRGHLILDDGIGLERRHFRLPRVGHGLQRLVVIGSDGFVSLAALRWLADQDVSFSMLDRDGSVLVATGPVRPSDARLRRAQALASGGVGLQIVRELIDQKLAGQERLAREKLRFEDIANQIRVLRSSLAEVESIDGIGIVEAKAAAAYWSAWRSVTIAFPRNDLPRVPDHWRTFSARVSPISGSPRLAADPVNAMLSYLYAVLESEARLAAAALGLDPGLGFQHVDSPSRDSLACDLMEPVRPRVDAFVLDWLAREPLRRDWLFEQRNGNCRLMASFAERLGETAPTWARAVAPFAEWVARKLWSTVRKAPSQRPPATPLTQRRRSEGRGNVWVASQIVPRAPDRACRYCGVQIKPSTNYCVACAKVFSKESLTEVAKLGRVTAQNAIAQARRAETQCRNRAAAKAWIPSDQPRWLTDEVYSEKIQPRLAQVTIRSISSALNVSEPYAADIRVGRCRPHRRHWQTLAQLAGLIGASNQL